MEQCAVVECENPGKPQICPYDNRYHHHGCVHYDGDSPTSALKFRKGGWYKMCDEHLALLIAEREAWMAKRETERGKD